MRRSIGFATIAAAVAIAASKTALLAQTTAPTNPPHRRHHALTYDPVRKRVILAGGQHLISNTQTPTLDDVWSWDGQTWTQIADRAGSPMITHKMFADTTGVFAVFPRGLVARWGGTQWNATVPDSMTRRESAAGAYDPQRKRFVAFGGLVGGGAYDTTAETWEFDGRQWIRTATSGPPAMFGGAMAYDSKRHVMVLFGGMDTTGRKLGATWEWNGSRWANVSSTGPDPRFGAGIAYDAKRAETVVFGGVDSTNQKLSDTWRWDGRAWHQSEVTNAPSPRSEGYMAFDDARGVVVMFGGEGPTPVPTLGDTWEWNGTAWTRRGPPSNAPAASQSSNARITFGSYAVGFRTVCDTVARTNAASEQLLIWYPAQRPPATASASASAAMPASEYLAPTRASDCGLTLSEDQRKSAIAVFARQLATAAGQPGEAEPIGGRLFPNDSATQIANGLRAAITNAFPNAQPIAGRYPIVVFAPAGAIEQSVMLESLASHGYIVVTFPHAGSPPNGFPREGAESGSSRDLTMAREYGRAIDAAVRFGNADSTRVVVIANGGFIPGAIWFQATTHRLSALVTMEGRVPGARLRSASTSTIEFRVGGFDTSSLQLEQTWSIPVLDWQHSGNEYTRGVLESLRGGERITLDAAALHPSAWVARRLVHPADTLANTANDVVGAYVLQFLNYALLRQPEASAFFDRPPEANGVPTGFLTVKRVRANAPRDG